MPISKQIVSSLVALVVTASACASVVQAAVTTPDASQPRRVREEEMPQATTVPTTGKLVFTVRVTVASSIPTTTDIFCSAFASVTEIGQAGLTASYQETATVKATRVSQGVATCTVVIPYSWLLTTPNNDTVSLNYTVNAGVTGAAATDLIESRSSSGILPSIQVPTSGARTPKSLSVTI